MTGTTVRTLYWDLEFWPLTDHPAFICRETRIVSGDEEEETRMEIWGFDEVLSFAKSEEENLNPGGRLEPRLTAATTRRLVAEHRERMVRRYGDRWEEMKPVVPSPYGPIEFVRWAGDAADFAWEDEE